MKAMLMILLAFCLFSKITSSIYTFTHHELHSNAEMPKIASLDNGNVFVITSDPNRNNQKSKIAKINKNNKVIYKDVEIDVGITEASEIVESRNPDNGIEYVLYHHNKQGVSGSQSYENITSFSDQGRRLEHKIIQNKIYKKVSVVSLKNGKIISAGANPLSTDKADITIDINIYDPVVDRLGTGCSFKANTEYISCYEQRDNEVYCVNTHDELLYSSIEIRKLIISGDEVRCDSEQKIKTFFTSFNFLKAIRYNDEEALILFQTGISADKTGLNINGKDLFLYQIKTAGGIDIIRYDYLWNECTYNENPEYDNADIAVFQEKLIYATCEYTNNGEKIFKGIAIYKDTKEVERFDFNGHSKYMNHPVFAKFNKNLALFYTDRDEILNPKVNYFLINYPCCEDYKEGNEVLLPRYLSKDIKLSDIISFTNSYPPSSQDDKINARIVKAENISVIYDGEEIGFNKDFDPDQVVTIKAGFREGKYDIEYTPTRVDKIEGLVKGRTCKISFNSPKCLYQCHSCSEEGTKEEHKCLGCRQPNYYRVNVTDAQKVDEYGQWHNCEKCDDACYSCYGGLIVNKTTNCHENKCNFTYNYFPFEEDRTLCISRETQDYWEENTIKNGIWLDKVDENDKETWIWRRCHERCRKCDEKGNDENNKCTFCLAPKYYFWCNQSLDNGGIPGNCHDNCYHNGYYLKKDEGREKCCACINNCKYCENDSTCDKCFNPFFVSIDKKSCDEDCGYCEAKEVEQDKNDTQTPYKLCINCKTYYPKYGKEWNTLNQTCVQGLEHNDTFNIPRMHHIIDDKCNLLIGCKDGCKRCDPWYSNKCLECNKTHYREDFFGSDLPTTYHCYNKTTCQGLTGYDLDEDEDPEQSKVGGVPVIEGDNNEKICLNCKLRNGTYRQVEHNFTCGPKVERTFIDIPKYNKLSECYYRCKECENWGNAVLMNCTKCRDGNHYEMVFKLAKYKYGNCYRKQHKCGIYPYYHDYDLAHALDIDEDDCGEDCDVCLYNFTCPEKLPYFVYETHECVEYCPITSILNDACNISSPIAAIIVLSNPFGLRNPYDYLNTTITIKQIISSGLFQYFAKAYNLDVNALEKDINNYIGNGKVYNLQESQIIVGNNVTLELSTIKLELEKLKKILSGEEDEPTDDTSPTSTDTGKNKTSALDLSECEAILKKKYSLPEEEELMIIKGDILQQLTEDYWGNQVEYQIFSTSLGAFLSLKDCEEEGTTVTVANPFDPTNILSQFQSKTTSTVQNGYNPFDPNSPFYTDICSPFTNENGNDVLLGDRRKDYYIDDAKYCESGCQFQSYNLASNYYTCTCGTKASPGSKSEYTGNVETYELPEGFKDYVTRKSNIEVFKCASQVFSAKGQKKNFGSYILLFAIASLLGVITYHFIKEKDGNEILLNKLTHLPANPPKPKGTKEDNKSQKKNKTENNENNNVKAQANYNKSATTRRDLKNNKPPINEKIKVVEDLKLKDEQLNYASFDLAKKKDKRTPLAIYWSLLKQKQLFIFTFFTRDDYILRTSKIVLFILFISFYLAFTALFFNDSIMRAIYIYKGNTDAAVHVPNIILSSLCCLIMSFIVRFISLNERDINNIVQIRREDERKELIKSVKEKAKIKLYILYGLSLALTILCWYYVSAFCAVFKNSQGHYFINTLVAFIVCNLWPCVTTIIPAFLRKKALVDNSKCLYTTSNIISYI